MMNGLEVLARDGRNAEWSKEEDGWVYTLFHSHPSNLYAIETMSPEGHESTRRVSREEAAKWLEENSFANAATA